MGTGNAVNVGETCGGEGSPPWGTGRRISINRTMAVATSTVWWCGGNCVKVHVVWEPCGVCGDTNHEHHRTGQCVVAESTNKNGNTMWANCVTVCRNNNVIHVITKGSYHNGEGRTWGTTNNGEVGQPVGNWHRNTIRVKPGVIQRGEWQQRPSMGWGNAIAVAVRHIRRGHQNVVGNRGTKTSNVPSRWGTQRRGIVGVHPSMNNRRGSVGKRHRCHCHHVCYCRLSPTKRRRPPLLANVAVLSHALFMSSIRRTCRHVAHHVPYCPCLSSSNPSTPVVHAAARTAYATPILRHSPPTPRHHIHTTQRGEGVVNGRRRASIREVGRGYPQAHAHGDGGGGTRRGVRENMGDGEVWQRDEPNQRCMWNRVTLNRLNPNTQPCMHHREDCGEKSGGSVRWGILWGNNPTCKRNQQRV